MLFNNERNTSFLWIKKDHSNFLEPELSLYYNLSVKFNITIFIDEFMQILFMGVIKMIMKKFVPTVLKKNAPIVHVCTWVECKYWAIDQR